MAVALVAAAGGFVAGRISSPEPDAPSAAFMQLLEESGSAVETRPVDPVVRAYADRLLRLADAGGSDPRTVSLLRRAAAGAVLTEIGDEDRDGLDDDGKVQLGTACVVLPISASYDVKVSASLCSGVSVPTNDIAYGPKRFPESYLRTL